MSDHEKVDSDVENRPDTHPFCCDAGGASPRATILTIGGYVMWSLLPWLFWAGMGFLNDTVLHIDRDWAIVLLVPGFAPFFIAERFGFSSTVVFFLTASYPTTAFIYMWLN